MSHAETRDEAFENAFAELEKQLRTSADGNPEQWIDALAHSAAERDFTLAELRSAATRLAWIARKLGHPIPVDHVPDPAGGTLDQVYRYVCGQRLRFDFNFPGLRAYLREQAGSRHLGDALVQSFDVFAKFGLRDADAVSTLNRVLRLPDTDTRVRQVCLAGIWAACSLPEQGTLLLSLCNTMIDLGEADGTVYFRRATAHRLLRMTDQALDDIDHALSLLPPGNNEINQDYLRERQLIGMAAHL
jgi:hypothetical protein